MLKVQNISFAYTGSEVIKNVSFEVIKGDYIALVGESGCGKSTLLEIIYGLLHVEKGFVYWNEEKLLGPNHSLLPGEDFMKYLPQDFDLMPYITVEENIGKNISFTDKNRLQYIEELLEVVDMSEYINSRVTDLSEGQKQRVAIAKVMAKEPEVLLLDEPFSNIDNFRKNSIRRKLFAYLKSKNITCIVATHDSTDALSFADAIVVIRNGEIVAQDTPEKLYNNPKNKYVGSLFNEVNEISAKSIGLSGKTTLLYPNQIRVVETSEIEVEVVNTFFKGDYYLIEAILENELIYFEHSTVLNPNQFIFVEIELS